MLRSRLYIGMLPVVGILIIVCLYSVFNYNTLNTELNALQTNHYSSISKIEQTLLATSQMERAIRLRNSDRALAETIHQRSSAVFKRWLAETPHLEDQESSAKNELALLVTNLNALGNQLFANKVPVNNETLTLLLQRIEESAIHAIATQNKQILTINKRFQDLTRRHFQIVLLGIVVSVFLMVLVAYVLSQRILKPIDALTRSATRLANDEWDVQYTPTSKDEISKLENAFVDMARRIYDYRRITNQKIMRTRRRMETCFNNLPHPVFFLNRDRTIVYQNPIATELIQTLDWDEALPEQLSARIETVFGTGEEILPTDFGETITFKVKNEAQHFLPIVVRIDSEHDHDIECAVFLQDVTNLRLSDEIKSDLVATLSHEIKTPVTSANLALLLVLEQNIGILNEDQEEMIQTASDDLKRLQRLLEHFLQIAQLENSIPQLNISKAAAHEILADAHHSHQQQLENKQIKIHIDCSPSLPPLLIDRRMIDIALSNYITNAIKYSPSETHMTLYARAVSENEVRFGVLDEGPGIAQEELDKVFEKFYRSPGAIHATGIGIGLSICKDIVAAHGGTTGCESRDPKGSDFFFILKSEESPRNDPAQ